LSSVAQELAAADDRIYTGHCCIIDALVVTAGYKIADAKIGLSQIEVNEKNFENKIAH